MSFYQTIPLSESVDLTVYSTDRFKSGLLSLYLTQPIDRKASPLRTLLFSVLRRGTVLYPTLADLNRRLDDLYGTGFSIRNKIVGDTQVMGFGADLLDAAYLPDSTDLIDGSLEIMEQMLFHPLQKDGLFLADLLESERKNTIDAIRYTLNDPRAYTALRLRELMFPDANYSASLNGTEEYVLTITPEDLQKTYESVLRDSALHFFYVGSENPESIAEKIRKRILSHRSDFSFRVFPTDVPFGKTEFRSFAETMPVKQSHLAIGYKTGVSLADSDYHAALLFNEIFGSMPTSKLFMNVREKLGLCYSVSSSYVGTKGLLFVNTGISAQNRDPAQNEITVQMQRMVDGKITDEEMETARRSLNSYFRTTADSPASIASFSMIRKIAGMGESDIEQNMDALQRVTKEDVMRVASGIVADTAFFLEGTDENGEEDDDFDSAN